MEMIDTGRLHIGKMGDKARLEKIGKYVEGGKRLGKIKDKFEDMGAAIDEGAENPTNKAITFKADKAVKDVGKVEKSLYRDK